jgi:hypothetical protein
VLFNKTPTKATPKRTDSEDFIVNKDILKSVGKLKKLDISFL